MATNINATVVIELSFEKVPTELQIYNYLDELMDSNTLAYSIEKGIWDE